VAVLLIACPLLCAAALRSGDGFAMAAFAAPVLGVLSWVHVSLFQFFLSATVFGPRTTDGFYAALDHPERLPGLSLSTQSEVISERVHAVIWGPTALGYCVLAVVAAVVAALAVYAVSASSSPAALLALTAAIVLAPMTVSRVPAQPAFAALPGQNDTCEQRLAKLVAKDFDPRDAEFIAVYYPQCLPPPPQIVAKVTPLGDLRVRFDATGTTGMGLEYTWLTQDVNTADGLRDAVVEFQYAQADVYQPELGVLDAFDRFAEWTSPPVAVR